MKRQARRRFLENTGINLAVELLRILRAQSLLRSCRISQSAAILGSLHEPMNLPKVLLKTCLKFEGACAWLCRCNLIVSKYPSLHVLIRCIDHPLWLSKAKPSDSVSAFLSPTLVIHASSVVQCHRRLRNTLAQ